MKVEEKSGLPVSSPSDEETVIGHSEKETSGTLPKAHIDPVVEKRLLRKLDLYLTPLTAVLCKLQFEVETLRGVRTDPIKSCYLSSTGAISEMQRSPGWTRIWG